jgi:hypothetical protein
VTIEVHQERAGFAPAPPTEQEIVTVVKVLSRMRQQDRKMSDSQNHFEYKGKGADRYMINRLADHARQGWFFATLAPGYSVSMHPEKVCEHPECPQASDDPHFHQPNLDQREAMQDAITRSLRLSADDWIARVEQNLDIAELNRMWNLSLPPLTDDEIDRLME